MGQNSTEVQYGFGQLGSAYSDVNQPIVPPMGMVIVAIQFLANNTPTVLTPEVLGNTTAAEPYAGGHGFGFPEITTGSNVTALLSTHTRNTNGRLMGQLDDSGANVQVTFTSLETHDMNVGDYVLLVNDTMQEDGNPTMTIDSETPIPIYSGRNKRGIVIKSIDSNDTITLKDSAGNAFSGLSPSSQSLIILGPQQGAGANVANGQVYPKGVTIYGRWTTFTPSAATADGGGVIAYFGY
jgi:hypothetical protein